MLILDEAQQPWYDDEPLRRLKPTELPLPDRRSIGA